jgi:hypothetical protein
VRNACGLSPVNEAIHEGCDAVITPGTARSSHEPSGVTGRPLAFLGIDPNSPDTESPTIWREEETGDLIIQSWSADAATLAECAAVGSIPGHATGVPAHESVIRLPSNMLQFLPRE